MSQCERLGTKVDYKTGGPICYCSKYEPQITIWCGNNNKVSPVDITCCRLGLCSQLLDVYLIQRPDLYLHICYRYSTVVSALWLIQSQAQGALAPRARDCRSHTACDNRAIRYIYRLCYTCVSVASGGCYYKNTLTVY